MEGHAWAAPWTTAMVEDVLPASNSIPLWVLMVFLVAMCAHFGWDGVNFLHSNWSGLCFCFVLETVLLTQGCFPYC